MALMKREGTSHQEVTPRSRDFFDRFFEDHLSMFRRPLLVWPDDGVFRVEEYREDGDLVVRAELAGIDPDHDVEVTVSDGVLHIEAERREEEEKVDDRNYVRREFRYGSFTRDLPLPPGVTEGDIKATYKDGILEIKVPMPETKPAAKIPVAKS